MDKIKCINDLIEKEIRGNGISCKDISDGHHTFRELYRQRLFLFCTICNLFPDCSWKSKKHFDEKNDPMFNGCFIVGINTSKGVATYHFKLEYWDMFDVLELEHAPKYDSYTTDDVLERVMSLSSLDKAVQKVKSNNEKNKIN